MFNYRMKSINAYSVFKYVTMISLIFGGFWGLLLGLLVHNMAGMLSGLFFGLLIGLMHGIVAYIYTFLFNLFASSIGGIEIQLERHNSFLDDLEQPIPLADTSTKAANQNDQSADS